MTAMTLRFTALDTLFFRESRPFESIGGSELGSLFPPPPRTVLGAVRAAIGDSLGVDWPAFREAARAGKPYEIGAVNLCELIGGRGDELGRLRLEGLWLSLGMAALYGKHQQRERLYPAPLYLLRKEGKFARLHVGGGTRTHLGRVRLPELPEGKLGFQPPEGMWLTCAGLEKVLAGGVPAAEELFERKSLFAEEPRLGIARDNARRTVENGLLYQTRHVRPRSGLAIEADVSGLEGVLLSKSVVRLGGEGRMAGVEAATTPDFTKKPVPNGETQGLIITVLTPARFKPREAAETWLPPQFKRGEEGGFQVWAGTINSIALTVHCAVIGKAQREGGWDMTGGVPRPVQSLISAGSSYYCRVEGGDIRAAIEALHGHPIGEDQDLGRGRIACGLWNNHDTTDAREKTS